MGGISAYDLNIIDDPSAFSFGMALGLSACCSAYALNIIDDSRHVAWVCYLSKGEPPLVLRERHRALQLLRPRDCLQFILDFVVDPIPLLAVLVDFDGHIPRGDRSL